MFKGFHSGCLSAGQQCTFLLPAQNGVIIGCGLQFRLVEQSPVPAVVMLVHCLMGTAVLTDV